MRSKPNTYIFYICFLLGIHSNFLVMPLLGLAEALASIRQTTKAVESYHRVVSILEASRGAESEDLVLPLCALGNLLVKEGKATDSENAFVRLLLSPSVLRVCGI